MKQHQKLKVNNPRVVHETIDGETILLDLKSGYYYSMDGSGSVIWDYLALTGNRDALLNIMCGANAAQAPVIEASLITFIEQLLKEGLLVEDGNSNHADTGDTSGLESQLKSAAGNFNPPKMNKYADMQDLLLLDPIHDVDEAGWPEPKDDQ